MTVAARINLSLTLSQMMDSMMAGVEKTGVLLHVVPTCRYVAAATLQALVSCKKKNFTSLFPYQLPLHPVICRFGVHTAEIKWRLAASVLVNGVLQHRCLNWCCALACSLPEWEIQGLAALYTGPSAEPRC